MIKKDAHFERLLFIYRNIRSIYETIKLEGE